MKQTEERSLYNLTLESENTCLVSLTECQVNLIYWLGKYGYDFKLEKIEDISPIVI